MAVGRLALVSSLARLARVAALAILAASAACVTTTEVQHTTTSAHGVNRRPAPTGADVTVSAPVFGEGDAYAFIDGATGQQMSLAEVLSRAQAAKVVVVGEQHDQRSHHLLQAAIVQGLGGSGGLAVGLEMLTWDKQADLDRFNAGAVDAAGLRDAVDWKKAWGFDFDLYAPIFEAGRAVSAQFVALNAPRELVRAMRRGGVEGLSPAERALLPDLDLGDELHRAWFQKIFSSAGHPMKPADLEGFYRAQVLWDEAMADRAVRALEHGARQVVVIAGAGHVAAGRGIPQRVERRIQSKVVAIVPLSGVDADNVVDNIREAVKAGEGDVLVVPRFEPEIAL